MKTNFLIVVCAFTVAIFSQATEIDAQAQRLMGLETAALAAKSLPPRVAAYGSVLSPAPLIELFRQTEAAKTRSEERRVGKECQGLCRSRWSPYH